jgi:hypothetical protein
MANDADAFNRWEAGQTLMTRAILEYVKNAQEAKPLPGLNLHTHTHTHTHTHVYIRIIR